MKTLWVHPGIGKTGTSAIQRYAARHLKAEAPVQYFPTLNNSDHHHELCHQHHRYDPSFLEKGAVLLRPETDALLSSELIGAAPDTVAKIINFARSRSMQLRVIITLRKPSEWFKSSYFHAVKTAAYTVGETLDDYVMRRHYPWGIVKKWRAITPGSVRVLEYHPLATTSSFFDSIGLSAEHFTGAALQVNESLEANQIEWLLDYDIEHGSLGRIAREHRSAWEFADLLTVTPARKSRLAMSATTLRRLNELDKQYENFASDFRIQSPQISSQPESKIRSPKT